MDDVDGVTDGGTPDGQPIDDAGGLGADSEQPGLSDGLLGDRDDPHADATDALGLSDGHDPLGHEHDPSAVADPHSGDAPRDAPTPEAGPPDEVSPGAPSPESEPPQRDSAPSAPLPPDAPNPEMAADQATGDGPREPIQFDIDDLPDDPAALHASGAEDHDDHASDLARVEHDALPGSDSDTDDLADTVGGVAAADDWDGPWTDPLETPAWGLTPPELTQHSLDVLGIDHAEFDAALAQIGAGDDELGLDGRTISVALGEVGADALVEHGGVDDLAHLLADGHRVVLTGPPDEPVLSLVGFDLERGTCTVQAVATGQEHVVPIATLDASWAAGDYQIVTATGPADGPIQLEPLKVAVVEAVISRWD